MNPISNFFLFGGKSKLVGDWEGSTGKMSSSKSVSSTKSWGTSESVSTVSDGTDSWGSSDGWGNSDGWGSSNSWSGNSVGNGSYGNSWLGNGVGNLMGLGVGAGLVDWLFVGYFSSYWSNDWFSSENWLLGKNWAGREGLGDNWGWLDGSDGSWLVDMGMFSNWDGLVSDFWGNFSKSFSSLYGICKVSSQSVVSDGSGIMCWGTDKGLCSSIWKSSTYKRSYASIGGSYKSSNNSDKGLNIKKKLALEAENNQIYIYNVLINCNL